MYRELGSNRIWEDLFRRAKEVSGDATLATVLASSPVRGHMRMSLRGGLPSMFANRNEGMTRFHRSAMVCLALLATSCSASPPRSPPTVLGTYEAAADGGLLWFNFVDATHYALLKASGCSLADPARPCRSQGTYAIDWSTSSLTLVDSLDGDRTTVPFNAPSSADAIQTTHEGVRRTTTLAAGDPAALAAAVGSIDVDGQLMTLSSAKSLVTGTPVGYLVAGPDRTNISPSVLCLTTLLGPRVAVTAAHCADKAAPASVWAFALPSEIGTGNTTLSYVLDSQFHDHPGYVDAQSGGGGLAAKLRENDLAYVLLEQAPSGVSPASLPSDALPRDCPDSVGESLITVQDSILQPVPACVQLALTLPANTPDPIYEVHPLTGGGVCPKEGGDGSPLFIGSQVVGVFVGSVVGAVMDCTSYLNGFESTAGHAAFLHEAIAAGSD